jgi:hypothetical protein
MEILPFGQVETGHAPSLLSTTPYLYENGICVLSLFSMGYVSPNGDIQAARSLQGAHFMNRMLQLTDRTFLTTQKPRTRRHLQTLIPFRSPRRMDFTAKIKIYSPKGARLSVFRVIFVK